MNYFLEQFIKKTFKKPGKVLDLGCGKLYDITCLKLLGWKGWGVDIAVGNKINLEKIYISKNKPFDLVFSNYVLHRINNKEAVIQSAYENLKKNGWLFMHTFDQSDKKSKNTISKTQITNILKKVGFIKISTKISSFYDNEPGHKHWHKILEIVAQK
jgi:ubiquinone/menaquinone biosynthesis C-methylase UbiE